jgi:hypothetical protein
VLKYIFFKNLYIWLLKYSQQPVKKIFTTNAHNFLNINFCLTKCKTLANLEYANKMKQQKYLKKWQIKAIKIVISLDLAKLLNYFFCYKANQKTKRK